MTIWWLIRLRLAMSALPGPAPASPTRTLKAAWRLTKWLVTAAVLVAAASVTIVAAVAYTGAWLRGWPPARLFRAGLWSLTGTAAYLAAAALAARTWPGTARWPALGWDDAYHDVLAGRVLAAAVRAAPLAVPAGLAAAGLLWRHRIYAVETGLSGRTATAPVVFDARQWRRQARTARGRVAVPGAVPLLASRGQIVMGATIRAVGHRWHPALTVSPAAMGRHQVIIGASGSGKTSLMIRSWVGWFAAALAASARTGAPRPLLVVLDCKGGPDARLKAARTRRLLHGTGAARVAVWPDEAAVSLWTLPPRELAVTLFQMIDTGTGPAAYYADLTQAVLTLAVTAPAGPPSGAAEFLARLDASSAASIWRRRAWRRVASLFRRVVAAAVSAG